MAEIPLQVREDTFQGSISGPVQCLGWPFTVSAVNTNTKDPVVLMEYSCLQLKGVTKNRVVTNQKINKGRCFSTQILCATTCT